jgi:hypothetical protein
MVHCNGFGECIKQCCCVCYDDEEHTIISKECKCGHRKHTKMFVGPLKTDIYCKDECEHECQLKRCHNFKICSKKRPQWFLNLYNGLCFNCSIYYGKLTFLREQYKCSICFESKDIIELSCGRHKFCVECWVKWSETTTKYPISCPICRTDVSK